MKELLRSGEFAKLCRTTKETLRHYRNISLFEPIAIAENGYALYALSQAADFALIRALQSAGATLDEIAMILKGQEQEELLALLQDNEARLQQQLDALQHKQTVLQGTILRLKRASEWKTVDEDERGILWRIERFPEERLIETAAPLSFEQEEQLLDALADHITYCDDHDYGTEMQATYRIERARLVDCSYGEGLFVATRVSADTNSDRLHVKPSGDYVCMLAHVPTDPPQEKKTANPLFTAIDTFLELIAERNIPLKNDLYITELAIEGERATDRISIELSMRLT